MNTKFCFRCAPLTLALSLFCCGISSQPIAPRPNVAVPTDTGKYLLGEALDFRKNLFDEHTIDDKIRRGVVSLVRPDFIVTKTTTEHSTNTWNTVSTALHSLGMVQRNHRTPQVRIIQRDRILQSSLDFSVAEDSGFSSSFLDCHLQAGDVVIITLLSE